LDVEETEVENVETMQNRPINVNFDHDHNILSLKVAYARNMWRNDAGYMRHIFRQIVHIFPHILPQKFSHILRKFSAINQHP